MTRPCTAPISGKTWPSRLTSCFFGVPATARASFAFYNTRAEVDRLVESLHVAREMLG